MPRIRTGSRRHATVGQVDWSRTLRHHHLGRRQTVRVTPTAQANRVPRSPGVTLESRSRPELGKARLQAEKTRCHVAWGRRGNMEQPLIATTKTTASDCDRARLLPAIHDPASDWQPELIDHSLGTLHGLPPRVSVTLDYLVRSAGICPICPYFLVPSTKRRYLCIPGGSYNPRPRSGEFEIGESLYLLACSVAGFRTTLIPCILARSRRTSFPDHRPSIIHCY